MSERLSGSVRRVPWSRAGFVVNDLAAWAVSLALATVLRYDGAFDRLDPRGLLIVVGVAVALQLVLGLAAKLYQGGYPVGSFDEVVMLAAVGLSIGACLLVLDLLAVPTRFVPLSVPFGGTFAAVMGMVTARAVIRTLREGTARPTGGARTLVFGAGDGGQQLVRSMLTDPESPYLPVGLIDDDPNKRHLRISGVRVLGTRHDLARIAREVGAEVLVVAIPSGEAPLYREVGREARRCGLEVKVLPRLSELLAPSRISIRDVRDIDVTDLLGRHQIDTDIQAIAGYLTGRRVLVTGAGGSIGAELCRQISRFDPAELMMLDRDESALHAVQLSLTGRALLDTGEVILADIRDRDRILSLFEERRPEVVFHAAALKHLPMLEQYPEEGFKTNVLGSIHVLEAAAKTGVERFVNISTDKAANPTSVLGRSKRIAERLTAYYARLTGNTYLSVRFGNVLGSRGSVLTAFAKQIAEGGPVTVTHPEVTRYFMTIPEAVQLVIQAAAIGRGGEVLILDMGEPVRIVDVARQLIEMANEDVEIVFTGLRPGEKLHEELLGEGETDRRPHHPLISHAEVPELSPDQVELADVIGTKRKDLLDCADGRPVDPVDVSSSR
ncbi:polysaccharide biosynthesis protein [Thermasporomyces composti]|uniref:FlaA1/EpsC-like NDP-sugar epimerase n=1 Tax=Thermasporomyces composti TaxID=696763 RepID=A0A3D9V3L8_THECX|nr:nucleoside-diphosphate sugar epimerase/dehydratase [Thermasporomyces composti]REF36117.1 FlaA1/EpsC-like NDP-sugar epimerase [Thermasporomyces composti]